MSDHHTPVSISMVRDDDPRLQPATKNPDRTARLIGLAFLAGALSFVAMLWAYVTNQSAWVYGGTMGLGFMLIGVGAVAFGKYLLPKGPFVEERHVVRSTDVERQAMAAALLQRGRWVGRRKVLGGLFASSMGVFTVGAVWGVLRSMGPMPGKTLFSTDWKRGSYLVDSTGRRIHEGDLSVGGVISSIFPEGFQGTERGMAVDQTILIRLDSRDFTTKSGRETWGPKGFVAYSKLCSHLGCPVGLYEQQLQLLVCPCHQSMFDVTKAAQPTFGPAPRPLPQLALYIDKQGFLRSQHDYLEPVGPGFWERS